MRKSLLPEPTGLIVPENRGAHSLWASESSWLQEVPAVSLRPELPQLISTCTHVYSGSCSLIWVSAWSSISARDHF